MKIQYLIAIHPMGWLTHFFMISGSNEQLQQQFEWTLLKSNCHVWWISKIQSEREDNKIRNKIVFKTWKNATETYGMLQNAFRPSCIKRASVFEWHKRFKKRSESVRDHERCGRSKDSIHQRWLAKGLELGYIYWGLWEFRKRFLPKSPVLFKSGQGHFRQGNAPVHNTILVTDYLTKLGINTVPYPPYSQDLAPCDFSLFPKPRDCRYETIEEMKEAVIKVVDTLTQEDFHGAFQKLLERYNKCIATGRDYFEGD